MWSCRTQSTLRLLTSQSGYLLPCPRGPAEAAAMSPCLPPRRHVRYHRLSDKRRLGEGYSESGVHASAIGRTCRTRDFVGLASDLARQPDEIGPGGHRQPGSRRCSGSALPRRDGGRRRRRCRCGPTAHRQYRPVPTEQVHMSLWLFRGSPPSNGKQVTVKVTDSVHSPPEQRHSCRPVGAPAPAQPPTSSDRRSRMLE
jgi:hypothetical protein